MPDTTKTSQQRERRLLDAIMASDFDAWEHCIARMRLYQGPAETDPTTTWMRRAHASIVERAGKFGTAPADAWDLPPNSEQRRALDSLCNGNASLGIVGRGAMQRRRVRNADGAEDGPRTPYETRLVESYFTKRRQPKSTLAYGYIKSLTLHVSPLGPNRERAACEVAYAVEGSSIDGLNMKSALIAEWADLFGVTERTAKTWLRELADADIGLELEVRRPQPGAKDRRNLWVVSLRLPPLDSLVLPQGATFEAGDRAQAHRLRQYLAGQTKPEVGAAKVLRERRPSTTPAAAGSARSRPSSEDEERQRQEQIAKEREENDKYLPDEFLDIDIFNIS